MNANLTISGLAFNQSYSDRTGSERREVSRGVNLPEIMSVRHMDIVDSKTKKSMKQSSLRVDRHVLSADGITIVAPRAVLTVTVPKDTAVTSADVLAVVERIVNIIQEDDTGLDLADEIFVNQEQ